MGSLFVHESALVHPSAEIGTAVRIWGWSHIRENATLGSNVSIGEQVYIGPGVSIGANCKIQNGALIYDPAKIEDGVFIGPHVILTNDKYPRAMKSDTEVVGTTEFVKQGVLVRKGASIGAGAVCIAPVEIGQWALVSAGSVVTKNIPSFALVAGSPARFVKWVGRSGRPLTPLSNREFICTETQEIYQLLDMSTLVLK